MPDTGIWE